ncbi:hypothetical protein [Nocardioides stalactiti]|uniref:hypothetical protein n=1 Tax=Nocardioides stalactiti TaxID=2755356 RepID=UPI001602BFAC|nr:hypothetical protein [Nocardioides stalactiti]
MIHQLAVFDSDRTFLVWFLVADAVLLLVVLDPRHLLAGIGSFAGRALSWEGKGIRHEFDLYGSDPRYDVGDPLGGGRWWPEQEHVHLWPDVMPWWSVRALEPLRTWLCERAPERARVGTTHPHDPAPRGSVLPEWREPEPVAEPAEDPVGETAAEQAEEPATDPAAEDPTDLDDDAFVDPAAAVGPEMPEPSPAEPTRRPRPARQRKVTADA